MQKYGTSYKYGSRAKRLRYACYNVSKCILCGEPIIHPLWKSYLDKKIFSRIAHQVCVTRLNHPQRGKGRMHD